MPLNAVEVYTRLGISESLFLGAHFGRILLAIRAQLTEEAAL